MKDNYEVFLKEMAHYELTYSLIMSWTMWMYSKVHLLGTYLRSFSSGEKHTQNNNFFKHQMIQLLNRSGSFTFKKGELFIDHFYKVFFIKRFFPILRWDKYLYIHLCL